MSQSGEADGFFVYPPPHNCCAPWPTLEMHLSHDGVSHDAQEAVLRTHEDKGSESILFLAFCPLRARCFGMLRGPAFVSVPLGAS